MVYEEFELCTIPPAEQDQDEYTMQIKTHSEAPAASFISRDNFVAVTVATAMALAQGAADCKTLDAPIGNPDFEISIFMTSAGMQLEVNDTTTGQKDRSTILWQDWFGE